jgi:hypothetical protein
MATGLFGLFPDFPFRLNNSRSGCWDRKDLRQVEVVSRGRRNIQISDPEFGLVQLTAGRAAIPEIGA